MCTAISSIIYRVAGRGTYPVAEQDRYVNHFGSVEELAVGYFDPEYYSYRVKLRRRSR